MDRISFYSDPKYPAVESKAGVASGIQVKRIKSNENGFVIELRGNGLGTINRQPFIARDKKRYRAEIDKAISSVALSVENFHKMNYDVVGLTPDDATNLDETGFFIKIRQDINGFKGMTSVIYIDGSNSVRQIDLKYIDDTHSNTQSIHWPPENEVKAIARSVIHSKLGIQKLNENSLIELDRYFRYVDDDFTAEPFYAYSYQGLVTTVNAISGDTTMARISRHAMDHVKTN